MYRANKNISNYIKIVIQVLQYFFVLLFVYAAVSKLLDIETFRVQLAQSPLLSAYAGILAWAVPVAELVIAGLLCFEPTKKLGLSGFFFMMVLFSVYIFFILKFADFVPCSCGGVLEKMSWNQHLIFNLFFVVISGFLLFRSLRGKRQRILIIGSQLIAGVIVVSVLFAFSERKMQRNNAFQRRYLPHPIEQIATIDLVHDTYYLAGVTDSIVYLGNYGAPLLLQEVHFYTQELKENQLTLSDMTLPYRRIKIAVEPPYFFLSDGTVPVIFRGELGSNYGTPISYRDVYFSDLISLGTSSFAFVTTAGENRLRSIGIIKKYSAKDSLVLKTDILKNTFEHNFGSDGMLLWNAENRKFLYLYYYRNTIEVLDRQMENHYSFSTIDTIANPLLKTVYSPSKNEWILTGGTTTVNRMGATFGSLLFISSDRLGKNEDERNLKHASIIDVYDFTNNSYQFSFYLYHQVGASLIDFGVSDGKVYAIVGNELLVYQLKPAFFSRFGFNSTYTARNQE